MEADEWDGDWPWDETHSDAVVEGSEQLEADLDRTIQDFESFQSDVGYQQAQTVLRSLIQKLDLTPPERQGLETEITSLQVMLDKLEHQVVHIAVFGMVSRGKSSLLNALLGEPVFATGPTHGVTQTREQARWVVSKVQDTSEDGSRCSQAEYGPVQGLAGEGDQCAVQHGDELIRVSLPGGGQSHIELIDTPGIDEIDGEMRSQLAHRVAQQADLILFVIAGDLTKVEYEALVTLRQASKPMVLVFNKIDQYPDADREAIYAKIRDERVKTLLTPAEIVMAAAAPLVATPIQRADGRLEAELRRGPPQVLDLKLKILEILDREGKALVALNTMLYTNEIQEQLVARKMEIRDHAANQMIWRSVMAKAVAIAVNPLTFVDILSSAVIDITMIIALAKLYGIAMTQQGAVSLLRNIAVAMGGITASELLATLGLSSLKGMLGLAAPATGGASLVPYLSVAVTQAAVAGASSYSIGQVTKRYLSDGASWGPHGPKTVVHEILAMVDQPLILNRIKTELRQRLETFATPGSH